MGGFECSCRDGFAGDGISCEFEDACLALPGFEEQCDRIADCVRKEGEGSEFTCQCKDGYAGKGFSCEDINECLDPALNNCHDKADCHNTEGSYYCFCPAGYQGDGYDGDGKSGCRDVDECALGTHDCNKDTFYDFKDWKTKDVATCTNTEGSFECKCHDNFEGDGVHCENINECTTGANDCDPEGGYCEDRKGSFVCYCKSGYAKRGSPANGKGDHCKCKGSCKEYCVFEDTNGDCALYGNKCNAGVNYGDSCSDDSDCCPYGP